MLQMPDLRDRILADGFVPAHSTPEEYGRRIARDVARRIEVVKRGNIKVAGWVRQEGPEAHKIVKSSVDFPSSAFAPSRSAGLRYAAGGIRHDDSDRFRRAVGGALGVRDRGGEALQLRCHEYGCNQISLSRNA